MRNEREVPAPRYFNCLEQGIEEEGEAEQGARASAAGDRASPAGSTGFS